MLRELRNLTLESFSRAVLDTRLIAADEWLDDLFAAYEKAERGDPASVVSLAGPIVAFRSWDREATKTSVPTTLFVLWTELVNPEQVNETEQWLQALTQIVEELKSDSLQL